jgi:ribonuclease-3
MERFTLFPNSITFADLHRLEETIGISFRNQALLEEALVHSSFLNENPDSLLQCNERLEFLGDALLDFVVGEYLYHRFPEMDEGPLTSLRSALIKAETLTRFAGAIQLGDYLYLSHGEDESGGRSREGLLGDAFEALVAAIYLDGGLDAVTEFVLRFVEPQTQEIMKGGLVRDYKSRLQEWAQREVQATPVYRAVLERGPDHAKEFTVEVLINGEVCGRGQGRSKQAAGQRAAQDALERISKGTA